MLRGSGLEIEVVASIALGSSALALCPPAKIAREMNISGKKAFLMICKFKVISDKDSRR